MLLVGLPDVLVTRIGARGTVCLIIYPSPSVCQCVMRKLKRELITPVTALAVTLQSAIGNSLL